MTLNLAKELDASIYNSIVRDDVYSLMKHYGLLEIIESIRGRTPVTKIPSSIESAFRTQAPKLYPKFLEFYSEDGSDL